MKSLSIATFALIALAGLATAQTPPPGPDPSGLLGLLVPPPDGSTIPNLGQFLNCLQPGGDPGKSLITALPTPTMYNMFATTPKLAFDMTVINCGELKQDGAKAANLVKQLLEGQITPQQFVQQLLQIDPKVNALVKQAAEDLLKTLQQIIPGIQNPLLKAALQAAANGLQNVINNPAGALQSAASAAQSAFQKLPPGLQAMAGAAASAVPAIASNIIKQLTGPASG